MAPVDIREHSCRGAVKLYADFYQSDIIVASPVALATKQTDADSQTLQDLAFLSSIEVLVAARCDVFQMQNWAHVISGTPYTRLSTVGKFDSQFNVRQDQSCEHLVAERCHHGPSG